MSDPLFIVFSPSDVEHVGAYVVTDNEEDFRRILKQCGHGISVSIDEQGKLRAVENTFAIKAEPPPRPDPVAHPPRTMHVRSGK